MYGRAGTIRVCPPCLPKSTAGGRIFGFGVADEADRLRPPEAVVRNLVLRGDAVDEDHAAVPKPQLRAAGVRVEFTAFDGFHNCPTYPLPVLVPSAL